MKPQRCTRALDFAKGFLKTDLIEKLGDLRYAQGDDGKSLSLYIKSFKGGPEEKLLEKIRHLSNKLGLWKDVKEKLISFMTQKGDSHNLIKIYLKEGYLVSALGKSFHQHVNNKYETERVAKACEKSMPYKAAELYRNMAEESIKQSNRNAYRTAKYYFKAMYRLYTSLQERKGVQTVYRCYKISKQKEICTSRRTIKAISFNLTSKPSKISS